MAALVAALDAGDDIQILRKGRKDCATFRVVVWIAGFVKLAYGNPIPAEVASAEPAAALRMFTACAAPYWAINLLRIGVGT
jgi:hypothetical protein